MSAPAPVSALAETGSPEVRAIPLRRPGRHLGSAVVLLLAATLAHSLITNPNYQWEVVGHYFTSTSILAGLARTLELTLLSMVIGIPLGIVLATMRLSSSPILSRGAWAYIWFFRGTPLLAQLIFWYNLASLYPTLSLGIPFGPTFVSANANQLVTPLMAAILGLGLNEGAYMAEIVRAGILSVDRGQREASLSLGMTARQTFRRIVLPQAMRVIVPPTGNQTIGMLKMTSLVSVISTPELLYSAELIYSRTFQPIPLLIVASLWYLIVTSVLSVAQHYIERHYSRGVR